MKVCRDFRSLQETQSHLRHVPYIRAVGIHSVPTGAGVSFHTELQPAEKTVPELTPRSRCVECPSGRTQRLELTPGFTDNVYA